RSRCERRIFPLTLAARKISPIAPPPQRRRIGATAQTSRLHSAARLSRAPETEYFADHPELGRNCNPIETMIFPGQQFHGLCSASSPARKQLQPFVMI